MVEGKEAALLLFDVAWEWYRYRTVSSGAGSSAQHLSELQAGTKRLGPRGWVLQKHGANDLELHLWQHPEAPTEQKLKRAHKML